MQLLGENVQHYHWGDYDYIPNLQGRAAGIDPEAEPISLCAALTQRQAGESLRIPSAASDFRLRTGQAPGGQAVAGLVKS